MRRLRRLAGTKTLYHGTSYDNFLKIYNVGEISPNAEGGAGIDYPEPDEDDYYYSDTDEFDEEGYNNHVEEYERQMSGFLGFTFFTGGLKTARDYSSDADKIGVVLEVELPEEILLPDDNDCYNCETWQDSLKSIDQVKVKGGVTSDKIKRIHFFNNNTKKKMFISTWDSWEKDMEENQGKVSGEQEYKFDPSIDEEAGLFFQKAQEAGLNVQNDVVVNAPMDSVVDIYNSISTEKGKQEDLQGFISNDGNINFTFHSIRNIASEPINFMCVGYSNYQVIMYANLNNLANIYSSSGLADNLKSVFEGKTISVSGYTTFTVDELIEKLESLKSGQTASVKRLLQKRNQIKI